MNSTTDQTQQRKLVSQKAGTNKIFDKSQTKMQTIQKGYMRHRIQNEKNNHMGSRDQE